MRHGRSLPGLLLSLVSLVIGELAIQPASAAGTDWPRYRGPDGSGHCDETGLPTRWSAGDVAWRTELGGKGHSSPCVVGDRIFVTSARRVGEKVERSVICLGRADGRVLWRHVASTGEAEQLHDMNSFATATCASEGERVVAFFGRGGIHCYDMDGKRLWSRDLGTFPGGWGTAASPVFAGGRVVQNCDAQGKSSLMALDARSGETVWSTERKSKPRGGWNTPILIDAGERRELVVNGEFGVRGYDPDSGRELWFCKGFNGRGTPIPAWGHGFLYVVNGKPGDIYSVRPGGSGDVTRTRMAWHTRRRGGRDLSSPILVGDLVFVVNMSGTANAYDAKTGRELWKGKLGGKFFASPIAARGLIYVQSEVGETFVIEPGPKLKIVARNPLGSPKGEIFRGTMAASGGRLFLRSDRAVYCVGK
ncbi:MAG: PQQ-like beta-propeller repeat protein [Planctomycetota bacterium]|jgi:outer membrane protein assembly factor BamB